ncbi:MAG TPA: glycoside hydrolase [Clostridiales bacterium]|nr:glycoside hydrolase [Clostridiales bacterium]
MLENLKAEVTRLGKENWKAMLLYTAELHAKSIHPVVFPFSYSWEEIGPGYCYRPAFGHWDIVHQVFDSIPSEPLHAKEQILNNLAIQQPDGFLPGTIWMGGEKVRWSEKYGHPPVWPVAVQDYCDIHHETDLIVKCYEPLVKQIRWFENNRNAHCSGFYYMDILEKKWESGVDDGIRFDQIAAGKYACIDATCHVYQLYRYAEKWSEILHIDDSAFSNKANQLQKFIQEELYDQKTGLFYDSWSVNDPAKQHSAFEGMWPVVVGAATPEQANRVIDKHLLNPNKFFTEHPISSVGIDDALFELRLWRGGTWNSMTYWAARGCVGYNRKDAAKKLLEKALDATAKQFDETGTIWEFYHPCLGKQEDVKRKPYTQYNVPCRDYLGHNPVIAMARMYEECRSE